MTTLSKPKAPAVNVAAIPAELREHHCWVCWKYELDRKPDRNRWKKPPIDCHTGRKADKTDPTVLAPFEKALAYYREHDDIDGIGFVFTPDGPFSGVDLDDCRDPETGQFNGHAEEIIRGLDSYGEVSPSGTGAKLIVRGKLPPGSRSRAKSPWWDGGIELYTARAYFTITGLHLPQTPREVRDRQEALLDLYSRVFDPVDTDEKVIARAMASKNGDKFRRLWEGDVSNYPSASEADQALCRLLAFWVGKDQRRIERLFGQSALGNREKWQEREDYRLRTTQNAVEDQAAQYQPPTVDIRRPNEAADDPHRLARHYVHTQATHPDGLTLHFWRDEWHRWNGRAYEIIPPSELQANVSRVIKDELDRVNLAELHDYEQRRQAGQLRRNEKPPTAGKVTKTLVGNVLQALTGMTVVPAATEQPVWVGGDGPVSAQEVLAAANGLFHLPTLTFYPATPRFFSPNVLDYDFDPNAPEPKNWLRFLNELWPDDPQSIETLQDWFGYSLTPDTRQQKMLLVVGPKRSGKGTIGRVLKAVVGPNNVAGPTLSSLGETFGLWPLLGRTVAIVSDARMSGGERNAIITERLLSIWRGHAHREPQAAPGGPRQGAVAVRHPHQRTAPGERLKRGPGWPHARAEAQAELLRA
jgi:primase-polymerase (primpol)-like protein